MRLSFLSRFLPVLFAAAGLFAGCDTTREAVRVAEAPIRISGVYEGRAVVRTIEAQRVVVALDEQVGGGMPDGQVDHVFTLQTETPLASSVTWDATPVRIHHVKGNLFVSGGGRVLHLRTAGFDLDDPALQQTFSADEAVVTSQTRSLRAAAPHEGVGLAHQLVPEGVRFSLADAHRPDAYTAVAGNACALSLSFRAGLQAAGKTGEAGCGPGAICLSGGPGATGCSHGSCSVNCSAGHFACCNGSAGCMCCKDGTVIEQ